MRLRSPLTTTAPTALLVALLAACAPAPETAATTTATGPGAADAPTTTAPGVETIGKLTTFDPAFATAVAADARIEKLTGDAFTWSEGPTWVRNGGYLLFDDVPANRMYRWSDADGLSVFLEPSGYTGPEMDTLREAGANGLFAEPSGTVLLADSGSRLVARFDPVTKRRTTLASHFDGKRLNSPNDVALRNDGSVFFTDPPYGLKDMNDSPVKEQAVNGIYRIGADAKVHLVDGSLSLPNGIAFSPDGNTLYVANSDPDKPILMAYVLDAAGNAGERRVFADMSDLMGEGVHGLPDGIAVSTDGLVFATGPGGVLVFDPAGKRLGRIETGSAIANVAFGGDDGRTLYMTSHKFLARVPVQVTGLGFQR